MPRPSLRSAAFAAALAVPAPAFALPEGEGREAVERTCTACHGVNLIERNSGYTSDDWDFLISAMIDLSDDPDLRGDG